MRPAIWVAAFIFSIEGVSAEEIAIRCDPFRDGDIVILFIDTSRKTVHWGTDANQGWWIDGKEYQKKTDEGENARDCTINISQFVAISTNAIEFGSFEKNINDCGDYDVPYGSDKLEFRHKAGSMSFKYQYTINRVTGIFTEDSGRRYQCQKFHGNPI